MDALDRTPGWQQFCGRSTLIEAPMKRSTKRWFVAFGILIGTGTAAHMIASNIDTVDPECDRVTQIRKDISHKACVDLAERGLLNAKLEEAGITWSQVHLP
jgi:hypothetical protein